MNGFVDFMPSCFRVLRVMCIETEPLIKTVVSYVEVQKLSESWNL